MTRDDFAAAYAVDGATLARLDAYRVLLGEWQARMNLVAASTLPDFWQRHAADSAQLGALGDAGAATTWLDIGSGAGLPALVLAALTAGRFHLIEGRAKKCAFLAAAAETLGVAERITIHNRRIEELPVLPVDIITARATASLSQLFDWGERFAARRWVLPKGRTVAAELAAARTAFTFDHALVPSRTAADGNIVVAHDVRRRRR